MLVSSSQFVEFTLLSLEMSLGSAIILQEAINVPQEWLSSTYLILIFFLSMLFYVVTHFTELTGEQDRCW